MTLEVIAGYEARQSYGVSKEALVAHAGHVTGTARPKCTGGWTGALGVWRKW